MTNILEIVLDCVAAEAMDCGCSDRIRVRILSDPAISVIDAVPTLQPLIDAARGLLEDREGLTCAREKLESALLAAEKALQARVRL